MKRRERWFRDEERRRLDIYNHREGDRRRCFEIAESKKGRFSERAVRARICGRISRVTVLGEREGEGREGREVEQYNCSSK